MIDRTIKIFDCNSHPTVDGSWLNNETSSHFSELRNLLVESDFCGAAAVGLPGVGAYDDTKFIQQCRDWNWIPIAAWHDDSVFSHKERLSDLRAMGYRGVKIHPRLMNRILSVEELSSIFRAAYSNEMVIMVCTYPCFSSKHFRAYDILNTIQSALHECPRLPLMLMHSGCIELMRYIEFARSNPSVVLDLSFTLMKYRGSSVDLDIAYAFNEFDKRIVIGTDYPEFEIKRVRERFEFFSSKLTIEKKENIAWRNASRFFGISENELT